MSSKKSRQKSNAYQLKLDKYKYTAQQVADSSNDPNEPELKRHLPAKSNDIAASYQPDKNIQTPKSLAKSYRFIKEIGHGHQAHVYLAIRNSINQPVAIKQLNIDSVKAWKEYELFHREAKILSNLNISGVAKFYDAIECLEDNPPCSYIIQEYIEGTSLSQMLKDGHRFQTSEVYDILLQMLRILKQLQNMDPPVIHRDIKPSNMMISKDSANKYKVTLIDFGAVANPQVQSGGSTVAGTYGYMPPEQLMGRPVPASDIYSLGAVAVELFSGISPAQLPVKDFRLIFEPEVQQLPVAVVNTLRSMLEPKTEDRLSDINKLIEAFQKYRSQQFDVDLYKAQNIDRDRAINRKLREVSTICEPGNMDLWQHLSDKTPRNVPGFYLDQLKEKIDITQNSAAPRNKSKRYGSIAVILFMLSIVLAAGFGILGLIIPLILCFWFVFLADMNSSTNDGNTTVDSDSNHIQMMNAQLLDLIKNGRKTIATIVDVKYLPLTDNSAITDNHDLKVVSSRPSFLVRYKFNPPDDAREEDLVHEYVSHAAPDGSFRLGDPLPILYMIEPMEYNDYVFSMPYPYPTDGAISTEVVYKSKSKPKFTFYKTIFSCILG